MDFDEIVTCPIVGALSRCIDIPSYGLVIRPTVPSINPSVGCIRHKQVLTYGRFEITSCFLFDYNGLKLEINEKNYRTYMNIEIEEYTIH